jgi:putative ABC transport system permease protein
VEKDNEGIRVLQDFRFAARRLRKTPGFTTIAVLCLALGIGANSAVFSLVNSLLLRALPFDDPDRLVAIWEQFTQRRGLDRVPASGYELRDYREQNRVFESISAVISKVVNLTGEGEPERLLGARVSATLFPSLGIRPVVGRNFLPEEDKRGNEHVLLLSYGLWQRRFNRDPKVVGRKLILDGAPYVVVGVLPKDFQFGAGQPEFYLPIAINFDHLPFPRDARGLLLTAKMKPGVTLERAKADMDGVARRMAQDNPDYYPPGSGWGVYLRPLKEEVVGKIRPVLLVLSGAVAFVLLIACLNVANLLLARATAREKEVAILTALGASRSALVRQFLAEGLLLSLWGGGLGLLLAWWALKALVAANPERVPRLHEIGVDWRVLAFTGGVAIAVGLLFGLLPAFRTSGSRLHELIKAGGKTSSVGTGRHRLRSGLVVVEVAAALVVLIGAGLMVRSFLALSHVDPGFRAERLLTLQVSLPASKYPNAPQQAQFFDRLLARLRSLPGVRGASTVSVLPLSGWAQTGEVTLEKRVVETGDPHPPVALRTIDADYFAIMGIPLFSGRAFTAADNAQAPLTAIVEKGLADRLWPGENPLGKRLRLNDEGYGLGWREVVGVVGNIKHQALDAQSRGHLYLPSAQLPAPMMSIVLRTEDDPIAHATEVRQLVWSLDRDQPISQVSSMDQVIAQSVSQPRFNTILFGVFAIVALFLAVVGVYGVMAYSVTQRTNEIGIRMSLGARQREVLQMIVGQGLSLTGVGVGIGLVLAGWLTRLMAGLLFGIGALDVVTFAGVALLLALLGFLASYVPARRATRVDPIVALRQE